jgi:hypothetical protein
VFVDHLTEPCVLLAPEALGRELTPFEMGAIALLLFGVALWRDEPMTTS